MVRSTHFRDPVRSTHLRDLGRILAVAAMLATTLSCQRESSSPPAAPTLTLAAVLDQRIRELEQSDSVFSPARRVEILKSQPVPQEARAAARQQLELADGLLRNGDTAEAVRVLEALRPQLTGAGARDTALQAPFRRLAAIAWLRLGEAQNCVDRHNSASCLVPIRGEGVHRLTEGSRRARDEYLSILARNPEDLEARWLLNLAAMTLGEYPDSVPTPWRIPPEYFQGEASPVTFKDIAPAMGVTSFGLSGGVVAEDLDGDLDLDLMVSSWGLRDPLRVFLNEGGRFVELPPEKTGLLGITGGLNLIHADYDNDGDIDVLVLRGAWMAENGRFPSSLLRNRGNASFEDVTIEAGLLEFSPTQTATWADFDNDGWLDLFFGHESVGKARFPCRLMRNLGNGRFADITAGSGAQITGFVKAVVAADFDGDGDQDLYLSRLTDHNLLLSNVGNGRFVDVTAAAGVAEPRHSFPVLIFDFDNDGDQDLFVSGFPASYTGSHVSAMAAEVFGLPIDVDLPRFYRNRGDGTFDEISRELGLARPMFTMGANFGDFDNDGFLDLYLGTGAPDFQVLVPNRAFHNDQGHRFREVTAAAGLGHLQKGHAIAFADFDQDFDQDIYAVLGGAYAGDGYWNALFENPGTTHHALQIRLEGQVSNRSAIGARLRLTVLDPSLGRQREIHATVNTGGSFGANSLTQEIGLGQAERVEQLQVQWPSGRVDRLGPLAARRYYFLREGEAIHELPWQPLRPAGTPSVEDHPHGH